MRTKRTALPLFAVMAGMAALCLGTPLLAGQAREETVALESTGPLVIERQPDVHIAYKRIQNPDGDCVVVNSGANVVIENSYIGPCKGKAVSISNARDVVVRHNYIKQSSSGLYAHQSSGVRFHNNKVRDVQGPRPRGQRSSTTPLRAPTTRFFSILPSTMPAPAHPRMSSIST